MYGTDKRYLNPYPCHNKFLSLTITPNKRSFNFFQTLIWGAEINYAHPMKNGFEEKHNPDTLFNLKIK